jgi:hypothetical protein
MPINFIKKPIINKNSFKTMIFRKLNFGKQNFRINSSIKQIKKKQKIKTKKMQRFKNIRI